MRYRPLGAANIQASAVGLGTWAIGGWMWGGQDDDDSIKAIHAAIDEGINLIDTAPMYGYGHSETVVGRAIAGKRDRVVLATKCGLRWDMDEPRGEFHFAADEKAIRKSDDAPYKVYRHLAPDSIRHELEQSLRRMHVECIDLYQTHWQDGSTPIEDTMAELLQLKKEGKVRAIGVSNAKLHHVKEYRAVGQLDAMQEKYSMLDRGLEEQVLPYTREHNIAVLAYSPLANGLLTGKIGTDREFGEGDLRSDRPRFSTENRQRVLDLLETIQPIAESRGITLAQLAIAWAICQPGLTHALVGARTVEQAKENAAAAELTLTDEELAAIDAALEQRVAAIV
jgi:aryl-alcohol dehydrogenase-like predicted oxidoreductase